MKIRAAIVRKPRYLPRFRPEKRLRRRDRNPYFHVAFGSLLAGLLGGTVLFGLDRSGAYEELLALVRQFSANQNASFAAITMACLLPSFGLGLLILYLGASPVGTAGISALLLLRGCGLGALAVSLARLCGKSGIAFYFACLLAPRAMQACMLLLLAGRAMQLSGYVKSCLKRDSFQWDQVWIAYGRACLLPLALLLACAPLDAFLQQRIMPSFASMLR